ncbi:hypothetical protein HK104_007020 [Borealophlyctis nickersoniae]|nr:hypothetical protein HK104_007020 [Borealophlyctis nickersoniae]
MFTPFSPTPQPATCILRLGPDPDLFIISNTVRPQYPGELQSDRVYVGGEDVEGAEGVARAAEGGEEKKEGDEEEEEGGYPGIPFARYSLHYALSLVMLHGVNLKCLRLHFHTENLKKLPWSTCLPHLTHLDLRMRVTDNLLSTIFLPALPAPHPSPSAPTLHSLTLSWAELSNASLHLVAQNCPNLAHISISLTDMNKRSRHHVANEPGAGAYVTDEGVIPLLEGCRKLETLDVFRLVGVSSRVMEAVANRGVEVGMGGGRKSGIKHLSVTLCGSRGVTLETIGWGLGKCRGLESLRLFSGSGGDYTRDKVVDEDDIMSLPVSCPSLKRVELVETDFAKMEAGGFTTYYGFRGMPWMVDDFAARWKKRFPKVELRIKNDIK